MLKSPAIKVSHEFLGFAREIKECISREKEVKTCPITINQGVLRTCISRAYYSVFLMARHIMDLDYYDRPDVHRIVIDRLKDMELRDIADKLFKLRQERNRADYDIHVNFTKNRVCYIVSIAESLLKELEKHLK